MTLTRPANAPLPDSDFDGEEYVDPGIAIKRRERIILWSGRVLLAVVVIAAWQLIAPHMDQLAVVTPTKVISKLGSWASDGTLWSNTWTTAEETIVGFVVGAVVGVIVGFVLGSMRTIAAVLDPFMTALYSIPKIALGPLFVVWFGINLAPKLILAALLVFFIAFFSTFHGVREVDPALINVARLNNATTLQTQLLVVLPASIPEVFLGLRLSVVQAMFGAIVGEFVASNSGLGYLLQYSSSQLDTAGVYAALVALTVFALVFTGVVNGLYQLWRRRRRYGV
jgi:NitT/TauT family transport system permease protein